MCFLLALINLLKFLMSNETVLLAKHNIFTLALMVSTDKSNPLLLNKLIKFEWILGKNS